MQHVCIVSRTSTVPKRGGAHSMVLILKRREDTILVDAIILLRILGLGKSNNEVFFNRVLENVGRQVPWNTSEI